MTLLRSGALVEHPVSLGPARAYPLRVAHLQDWKLPFAVHLRAGVPPIFTAPIGLRVGLGDIPLRDGFSYPHLGRYVDAERNIAVRFAPPNHDPIKVVGWCRATCKKCAHSYERFITCLHFRGVAVSVRKRLHANICTRFYFGSFGSFEGRFYRRDRKSVV